jgi:hypothetical protein
VPSPVAQEVSAPDEYGFLDLIASAAESGADLAMRATLCSTSVCQTSRLPCSVLRT